MKKQLSFFQLCSLAPVLMSAPFLALSHSTDRPANKFLPSLSRALGERPILVFWVLMLLSGLLYYILILFVSATPGLRIFSQETDQSAWLMAGLIGLVCGVLLWRLTVADKNLRKMILDKYREAITLTDSGAQETIRDLAGRLGVKRNLYKKSLRLITLAPGSFLNLILFLAAANLLVYLAFAYLPQNDGTLWKDVHTNFPWAFATLICLYLVYNDIKVIENLRSLIESITIREFAGFYKHVKRFETLLTKTELMVMENIARYHNLSDKEKAFLLTISHETFKTHKYNLMRKWDLYSKDHDININLEKLLKGFYSSSE